MFLKAKTETKFFIDTPLITIRAVYKNTELGKMICLINENTRSITISDIVCKKNNKGYGSLMMEKLIGMARQNGYMYIDGWLSTVDMDHIERLYHFYQKFGFEIVPNRDGMKFADIKLIL